MPNKSLKPIVPQAPEPKSDAKTCLRMPIRKDETNGQALARAALMPELASASIVHATARGAYGGGLGDLTITDLVEQLQASTKAVNEGDLGALEGMLAAQASALNTLFSQLTQRAVMNMGEYLGATDTYLRLALRAQNQCRTTIETLATIKNPRVVFAKQANIAHGHQQVNNELLHAPTLAGHQNKLLENEHGEWLDSGAKSTAGRGDQTVEAVGTVNRTTNRGRKGRCQS